MLLSEVASGLAAVAIVGDADPVIRGVTHDSRRVKPGYLFCCLRGAARDGHDFAAGAIRDGAAALLCERALALDVPQVVVESTRVAMARAAANFWHHPARDLTMIGVTGTNGKTTTVAMVTSVLESNDVRTATIGTLASHLADSPPTTPDSTDLQALLATFRDDDFDAVAMEVSSHALVANRVDEIVYDVAAFTNLSQDHLDLHGTMDAYFAAKASLFTAERAKAAVVCIDTEWGSRLAGLAAEQGLEVVRCSVRDMVIDRRDGPRVEVRWNGAQGMIHLAGEHNVANAIVAATVGEVLGIAPDAVLAGLGALRFVPGRFEHVDAGQSFAVVVDYAHTPDGVEVALRAARSLVAPDGRVTIVVGCGGDRDRGKRPLMAAAAEAQADRVILTSDNPRHEDPRAILEEMQTGLLDPSGVIVETDRAAAIRLAIEQAAPGDVVLIAGKGHETTQTIGDAVLPFDDREVARAALRDSGA
ncbi:MAG TPA: UDP-N-acetylmuramoyl-L-alanyl-D-glutamate--2,6-diaminopimelate ligase [Acidimicrobiales bacterium]|nr:UDP-N-acetylmuramoyl-L-alanyl-D-glutamate--2,6-diaminopimelate ligase [Acidimicrobiales bacterium]